MPVLFALGSLIGLLILAAMAILLFGHRLPGTMRSLGRGVVEFKKGLHGIEDGSTAATKNTPEPIEKKPNT